MHLCKIDDGKNESNNQKNEDAPLTDGRSIRAAICMLDPVHECKDEREHAQGGRGRSKNKAMLIRVCVIETGKRTDHDNCKDRRERPFNNHADIASHGGGILFHVCIGGKVYLTLYLIFEECAPPCTSP